MAAIAGIGFLIKYILIPGQERKVKYGRNVELYLFGMDRHEWGSIHLIIGYILIGFLALHIILHWKTVMHVYNRLIKNRTIKNVIVAVFLIISSSLIVFSFFVTPEIIEIEEVEGKHALSYDISVNKDQTIGIDGKHSPSNLSIEVKGFMSLNEVSNKYSVPTKYIKLGLNIPESISDMQKFGQLRKEYKFKMSEVEKLIIDYLEING